MKHHFYQKKKATIYLLKHKREFRYFKKLVLAIKLAYFNKI